MNGQEPRHGLLKAFGWLLILLGLALNEWVIAALFTPGRPLDSMPFRIGIVIVELLLILAGIGVIRSRHRIGGALNLKRILVVLLVSTAVTVAGAELALRQLGFKPFIVVGPGVAVEPGGRMFEKDPALGYRHLPGSYEVTILHTGYTFRMTHGEDSLRLTRPAEDGAPAEGKEQIWLFGCSYTHGWTLDDQDTYAWKLQEMLPDFEVVNFGVVGYGTLHNLIEFREALETRGTPRAAVVAYAGFHDRRNTFVRRRRKLVATWNSLGPLSQPRARLGPENELVLDMAEVAYREFPLQRSSALVHMLEQMFNRGEERIHRSREVSREIIRTFSELCAEKDIDFLLAGINQDPWTAQMLADMGREGIPTVDISVDLTVKENNNKPHDHHPSAVANRKYADKLLAALRAGPLKE